MVHVDQALFAGANFLAAEGWKTLCQSIDINEIKSVSFDFNLVYVGILVSEVNRNGLDGTIMR